MLNQPINDPPRWPIRFLRWFCRPDMLEDIEGDLMERYQMRISQQGLTQANRYFRKQVLLLFRPGIIKHPRLPFLRNHNGMLKKYFQYTARQLLQAKNYAVINIFGLAVGIAACLIILLYINEEWSYDSFHAEADAIYRVTTDETEDDGIVRHLANAYPPLAPLLASTYPEIKQACRYFPNNLSVKNPENNILNQERKFFFADSVFFDLFSFQFEQGVAETALDQPNAVVLTESTARRYFKDEDPMGKSLLLEGGIDVKITGIIKDIPANSSLQFDFIGAISIVRKVMGDWALHPQHSWHYPPMYTFIKVPNKDDAERLIAGMDQFGENHLSERLAEQKRFKMQPLRQVHFESLEGDLEPATNPALLHILLAVAFLILAIGCSNYINLALSRSVQRFREIGMRKVLGAGNGHILTQLSVESFSYLIIALVLAIGVVQLALPHFNGIMQRDLSLWANGGLYLAVGTILVLGLMGLINAFFPYLAVTRFDLNNVIKGGKNLKTKLGGGGVIKNGFVVFQFVTAIVLLVATFTIQQQLRFIQQKNLGLQTEQIMIIPIRDDSIQNNFSTAKELMLSVPGVTSVSAISNFPWERGYYNFQTTLNGQGKSMDANLQTLLVEEDFISTLDMEVLQGRPFSKDFGSDGSSAFILNEAAAKKFNIQNLEGIRINMASIDAGDPKVGEVVGVVKDFHFKSLHHEMEPVALTVAPRAYFLDNFVIRLQTDDLEQYISQLSKLWGSEISERPFEYFFLDEAFQTFYLKETRLAKIFSYFSLLALIIAGLGLFALAAYLSERRMKEMSIRKILGAAVWQIIGLLSKDFVRLVLIAIVVGSPLAWLGMNYWLNDFAFRVDLQWWVFVGAGAMTLAIAVGTVSLQGLKTARANPVENIQQD
ncbi:MAG: ABC transporter permease [Saprospiraceae bacterium]|nr:ABC transporter permease [Saprospiraceae bacterium]